MDVTAMIRRKIILPMIGINLINCSDEPKTSHLQFVYDWTPLKSDGENTVIRESDITFIQFITDRRIEFGSGLRLTFLAMVFLFERLPGLRPEEKSHIAPYFQAVAFAPDLAAICFAVVRVQDLPTAVGRTIF